MFLFWIEAKPDKLVERVGNIIDKMNDADIGPCAIWSDDTGALLMVPRAIPTRCLFEIIEANRNH